MKTGFIAAGATAIIYLITPSCLCDWKHGRYEPKLEKRFKIAKLFSHILSQRYGRKVKG